MARRFSNIGTGPATVLEDITLDDDATYEGVRGFMASGAGTLNVTDLEGTNVTLTILASTVYPIAVKKFRTGGTATGVVALY